VVTLLKRQSLSLSVAIMLLSAPTMVFFPGLALAQAPTPVRITTSFDVKHADAVLKRVARLFSAGFTRPQADQLAQAIYAMKAEQPMSWEFQVTYQGQAHLLQVRALLDDLGMVDLDFATSPQLAPAVRAAVDGYLNSLNP
jgi:hypothetical protein